MLNAKTCAVIRVIDPVSELKFFCVGQSFMKIPGDLVSLVYTSRPMEVQMICYNQAEDTITTIHNYGRMY